MVPGRRYGECDDTSAVTRAGLWLIKNPSLTIELIYYPWSVTSDMHGDMVCALTDVLSLP